MRKASVVLSALLLLSVVSISAAEFTITNTTIQEDWEGSDSSINHNWNLTHSVESYEGSRRLIIEDSTSYTEINSTAHDPLTYTTGDNTTVIWDWSYFFEPDTGSAEDISAGRISIVGQGGSIVYIDAYSRDGGDIREYSIAANRLLDGSDITSFNNQFGENTTREYKMIIDWDDNNIWLYINGTEVVSSYSPTGTLDEPDTVTIRFGNQAVGVGRAVGRVDDIGVTNGDDLVVTSSLEATADTYMEPDSSQSYTVTLNETTLEGETSERDVTQDANVTSSNTSILTVDNSTDTLNAVGEGTVNVTFEYEGATDEIQIFVGPRTIADIGKMDSPQWIPAILGIGEEGTGPGGIGSEMQWLLVLIMIMYGVTYQTNSASVGIGIGVGGVIALWVAGYVSVGMLLSTMLFGAFIALTTLDLQNDQTVVHEYR